MKETDILIVGQGIAGTVLSQVLEDKGLKVHVLDNDYKTSCSTIAAGIYHPFVFKNFGFAWHSNEFIENAVSFYQKSEKLLGVAFHFEEDFYRIFKDMEEQNNWFAASENNSYKKYFTDELTNLPGVNAPFGSAKAKAYRVDLPIYLSAYKSYLIKQNAYTKTEFDFCRLNLFSKNKKCGNYNDEIKFKKIIFCEGHKFVSNPFFNYLPANLTKGEILHINSSKLHPSGIINKGCFLLALKNNKYIAGATYDWKSLDYNTTYEAREELVQKVGDIYSAQYDISHQYAGIRPTIPDRKPLIGVHPNYNNVYLFNGLGSKGVMMAPLLARNFYHFVFEDEPLPPEINITRFEKKHFPKWAPPPFL
ncbi:MAG: NAD(P)/FAD-dependent oxidoreductase [Flavobacteriales bacterium]